MNDKEAVSFATVLSVLLDEEHPFPPGHIYHLSRLPAESLTLLDESWERIPLPRRRSLLSDMEALAVDDPLLFFDQIALIGLRDEDVQVRISAIALTALEEEPRFAEPLIDVLAGDSHFEARAAAAAALSNFVYLGEIEEIPVGTFRAVEEALLTAFRQDELDLVRRKALEAISFSSRPEINGMIEDAYTGDDEDWQISAVYAMGASANLHWEKYVVESLSSDSPQLRYEAVRAAGKLSLSDTKPDLLALAQEDEDGDVRAAAVWALSDIGGQDVAEFLESLLEEAETEAETEFFEEALENLLETQMFDEMDMPLFDFDEDDLADMDTFEPKNGGDA